MRVSADGVTGRIAVLTRFTVTGDQAEFDRLFAEHETYMRAQEGFVDCYLLRSVSRPRQFSHVGWWESPGVYQRICDGDEYKSQMKGLLALADIMDVDVCTLASGDDRTRVDPA
ncbi:antibiotic biosynthesis monooxygenase family protein [Streptomyces sp. NPDC047000]|uniref:antibiotic biosynthesis monooxygenase family protein n=1 Tax=Streptomyces sp. NPDC047000 TaxID=3155474 RepID=UPI0033EB9901